MIDAYDSLTSKDSARAPSRHRREDMDCRLLLKPLGGLVGLVADPRALVVVALPCLVLQEALGARQQMPPQLVL